MQTQGFVYPVFTAFETGQQDVTGTATALPSAKGCGLVRLSAPSTNDAPIYFGPSDVATYSGAVLSPGQSVTLPIDDLAKVYVVSAAGSGADCVVCWEVYR